MTATLSTAEIRVATPSSHRPEIDGLRAFAVLPVLLVHAGFSLISGGFLGVDIFFVISGFLITNILYGEIEAGRLSITKFYERRARRILPALFLVIGVSLAFGWCLMLPDDFRHFAQSLIASLLFVANMFFAHEDNYFNPNSAYKPLLHLWSLGVEEQFYVIFPLFILIICRFARKWAVHIVLLLIFLSITSAELGWRHNATVNFFVLPSRAWELLAGCLLALLRIDRIGLGARHPMLFQGLSLLGLASICTAYFWIDSATPSPSLAVAPPVIGAVLILACAIPGTICHAILSNRAAAGIGLISYSAYLWHQPVFVFARIYSGVDIPPLAYLGLIGLVLGLAYLTWRFVENPIRDRRRIGRKPLLIGAAAFMGSFLMLGLGVQLLRGVPGRFVGPFHLVAEGASDISPYRDSCGNRMPKNFENFCVFGSRNAPIVAILGDSHGKELFWRATAQLAGRPYALQPFLWNACPPFASLTAKGPEMACHTFHERMFSYILGNPRIQTVVLAANWPIYFNCRDKPNCFTSVDGLTLPLNAGQGKRVRLISEAMGREIAAYRAAGKTVILVYAEPQMPWNVPLYMLMRLRNSQNLESVGVSLAAHEARSQSSRAFLDDQVTKRGVLKLDPASILCAGEPVGFCKGQLNGMPLYFDNGHINGHGADLIASRLLSILDGLYPSASSGRAPSGVTPANRQSSG